MQGKFYILRQYFVLAFIFISSYSFSQISHPKFEKRKIHYNDFNHFIFETPWDIQFGWSAIDDDGQPFKDLLSISKVWNIGYFPSRVAISKKITKDLKGEVDFAFNTYRANKLVNSEILKEEGSFFTFDVGVQYDLNRLVGYTWIFDPFIETGIGYTRRSISKFRNTLTYNLGFGTNIWFSDNIGAYIQSDAKIGFQSPFIKNSSNYFQHSLGVVFKISGNSSRFHIASMKIKNTYKRTRGRIKAKF